MPQLVLWAVAGSALFRLWGSQPTWLLWCLGGAMVLDCWVAATVRRIHAGKDADVLDTPQRQHEAMVFWVKADIVVVATGIILAVYGHVIA